MFSSPYNSLCFLQVSVSCFFVWDSLFHAWGFLQISRDSVVCLLKSVKSWLEVLYTAHWDLLTVGFTAVSPDSAFLWENPRLCIFNLLSCAQASCKEAPPHLLPADKWGVLAWLLEPVGGTEGSHWSAYKFTQYPYFHRETLPHPWTVPGSFYPLLHHV